MSMRSWLFTIIVLLAGAALFAAVYVAGATLLRVPELHQLWALIRRRVRKGR